MNKILQAVEHYIAAFGMSLTDVAFMAHFWFACSVVLLWPHWWTAVIVAAAAAAKEFYFDAHFEVPLQTLHDNLVDWTGYLAGILFALMMR